MAHTVTGGIGDRRILDVDPESQHRADAAAMHAVAGRVGTELVALEGQREPSLGDLDAAELDPAGRLPGFTPLIAIRKRRPQPESTRPGHAGASARIIASAISWAQ